jgi:hypothetical protein
MAKDPTERYASTADLIEDLHAIANGQPPAQAHKLMDLPQLATLEEKSDSVDTIDEPAAEPLTNTPLFWIAVVGWALVLIQFIILILIAT